MPAAGATFIGFGGSGTTSATTTNTADNSLQPFYNGDHGELRRHLSKLSKRDPTTLRKALDALRELIPTLAPETVVEALPHWTFTFSALAFNADRRVRLAAARVLRGFVDHRKRALRPHMPRTMGAWRCLMCDPARDVAAAANDAFEACFPEDRRAAVVERTAPAVLETAAELLEQPLATGGSAEDKAVALERFERTHAQALSALAAVGASSLPATIVQELKCSKCPPVRRAAFRLVSAVVQGGHEVPADVAAAVFKGVAADTHPSVIEAVVLLLRRPEHEPDANFGARLQSALRKGLAPAAYPALRPLIEAAPQSDENYRDAAAEGCAGSPEGCAAFLELHPGDQAFVHDVVHGPVRACAVAVAPHVASPADVTKRVVRHVPAAVAHAAYAAAPAELQVAIVEAHGPPPDSTTVSQDADVQAAMLRRDPSRLPELAAALAGDQLIAVLPERGGEPCAELDAAALADARVAEHLLRRAPHLLSDAAAAQLAAEQTVSLDALVACPAAARTPALVARLARDALSGASVDGWRQLDAEHKRAALDPAVLRDALGDSPPHRWAEVFADAGCPAGVVDDWGAHPNLVRAALRRRGVDQAALGGDAWAVAVAAFPRVRADPPPELLRAAAERADAGTAEVAAALADSASSQALPEGVLDALLAPDEAPPGCAAVFPALADTAAAEALAARCVDGMRRSGDAAVRARWFARLALCRPFPVAQFNDVVALAPPVAEAAPTLRAALATGQELAADAWALAGNVGLTAPAFGLLADLVGREQVWTGDFPRCAAEAALLALDAGDEDAAAVLQAHPVAPPAAANVNVYEVMRTAASPRVRVAALLAAQQVSTAPTQLSHAEQQALEDSRRAGAGGDDGADDVVELWERHLPAGLRDALELAWAEDEAKAAESDSDSDQEQDQEQEQDQDQEHALCLLWLATLHHAREAAVITPAARAAFADFLNERQLLRPMLALLVRRVLSRGRLAALVERMPADVRALPPLRELAAFCFYKTLAAFPTQARAWADEAVPRAQYPQLLRLVEEFACPLLVADEVAAVKDSPLNGGDPQLAISASRVSRQVLAMYSMDDDCRFEMTVTLPAAYPLRKVDVACTQLDGYDVGRSRRWVLQMLAFLNAQDGCILDAVLMWKRNVDKELDGVEPCPICYSVLHPKNHRLPGLECSTCSNRFHNSCLLTWLSQSGKSKCPICQQPWRKKG